MPPKINVPLVLRGTQAYINIYVNHIHDYRIWIGDLEKRKVLGKTRQDMKEEKKNSGTMSARMLVASNWHQGSSGECSSHSWAHPLVCSHCAMLFCILFCKDLGCSVVWAPGCHLLASNTLFFVVCMSTEGSWAHFFCSANSCKHKVIFWEVLRPRSPVQS